MFLIEKSSELEPQTNKCTIGTHLRGFNGDRTHRGQFESNPAPCRPGKTLVLEISSDEYPVCAVKKVLSHHGAKEPTVFL